MTGFESKRRAAQDKLDDDADTLLIVYQRGFADGKQAAQRKPLTDAEAHKTLLGMVEHIELFGDANTTDQQLSAECIRFILDQVAAHNIKEQL